MADKINKKIMPAEEAGKSGKLPEKEMTDDEKIDAAAKEILERYKEAFKKLAE